MKYNKYLTYLYTERMIMLLYTFVYESIGIHVAYIMYKKFK